MRLSILLAAAAAAERVDRDADGVPDAAPEGACCECCYGCNPVWKSKFYGAFVLNRRVVLHAIDATPDALVDFHTDNQDGRRALRQEGHVYERLHKHEDGYRGRG